MLPERNALSLSHTHTSRTNKDCYLKKGMMKLLKEVVIFEHSRLYLFRQIIESQLQKEMTKRHLQFICKLELRVRTRNTSLYYNYIGPVPSCPCCIQHIKIDVLNRLLNIPPSKAIRSYVLKLFGTKAASAPMCPCHLKVPKHQVDFLKQYIELSQLN